MAKIIWIAWEKQRRTTELAKEFKAKLYQLDYKLPRTFRYLICIYKTLKILKKERPKYLFVQNPSIFLAAVAVLLRKNFKVVVDTHTSILNRELQKIFRPLTKYIIKNADLTIVTNENIKHIIETKGGKAFVLPDKIPLFAKSKINLKKPSVLFISTFANDEPFEEVIKAAKKQEDIFIYITGNTKKFPKKAFKEVPSNVIFTGFLSDKDYIKMLNSVDVVMDLTRMEDCVLCGAYEAVAVEKPLITSNKRVLKNFFNKGTVHVNNTAEGIAKGISYALKNTKKLTLGIKILKAQRKKEWQNQFKALSKLIGKLN